MTIPFTIDLHALPSATMATHDDIIVAANAALEKLTGWTAERIVGRSVGEVIGELIVPADRGVVAALAANRHDAAPRFEGRLWLRILTASQEERHVRVEWMLSANRRDSLVSILDAQPEAFGQEVTEALARVAGALGRCATEHEVLEHAVDALCERGFIATALLIEGDDPLLRFGPSRNPQRPTTELELHRPPRSVLTEVNPGYMDRRAAFFMNGIHLVRETYAKAVAEGILATMPAERMVQAPLFVDNAPYGALVVIGESLTPLVATALDLFAELVGKALETVRLRKERVERERLAALGEAAGVMAHEVRNPVGSIMNALTLLKRPGTANHDALLAIISEEAARLEYVVAQLLDIGRPILPRPCPYSMEDLTRRALRLLDVRGELRAATLVVPTTTTLVWADPDLVELALVNVLRNAAQASTSLQLAVEAAGAKVAWWVEDGGPGITDAVAQRLGEPFVTTRATGTGMGLAVVRRIMDASDGTIAVTRAVNGGTRVTLRFPAHSTSASVPATGSPCSL